MCITHDPRYLDEVHGIIAPIASSFSPCSLSLDSRRATIAPPHICTEYPTYFLPSFLPSRQLTTGYPLYPTSTFAILLVYSRALTVYFSLLLPLPSSFLSHRSVHLFRLRFSLSLCVRRVARHETRRRIPRANFTCCRCIHMDARVSNTYRKSGNTSSRYVYTVEKAGIRSCATTHSVRQVTRFHRPLDRTVGWLARLVNRPASFLVAEAPERVTRHARPRLLLIFPQHESSRGPRYTLCVTSYGNGLRFVTRHTRLQIYVYTYIYIYISIGIRTYIGTRHVYIYGRATVRTYERSDYLIP